MHKYLFLLLLFLIVGGFILTIFRLRVKLGIATFFVCIGVLPFFQNFISYALVFQVSPGVTINLGAVVFFSVSLFTFLLMYLREDANKARSYLVGLIIIPFAIALFKYVFTEMINLNMIDQNVYTSNNPFIVNLKTVFTSPILFFFDCIFIFLFYNKFLKHLKNTFAALFCIMTPVLILDNLLFNFLVYDVYPFEIKQLMVTVFPAIVSTTVYTIFFGTYLCYIQFLLLLIALQFYQSWQSQDEYKQLME